MISNNNDNNSEKYFTIPFIKTIYNSINSIAKSLKLKIAFSIKNNLNNFIKVGKDKLEFFTHSEVVYLIPCRDCQATYVGQTKRQLHTRIKDTKQTLTKTMHHLLQSLSIDENLLMK